MVAFKTALHIGLVAVILTVSACATSPEPFDYQPDNELKPGPGLLSGEEGAFTIYRKPMEPGTPETPVSPETPENSE
jgi:hypothetical protein